jgi:hypothetical protein
MKIQTLFPYRSHIFSATKQSLNENDVLFKKKQTLITQKKKKKKKKKRHVLVGVYYFPEFIKGVKTITQIQGKLRENVEIVPP